MSFKIDNSHGEVTQALQSLADGDVDAIEHLLPLVYEELRTIASNKLRHERPDHTLQATALVHEVFVRLFGNGAKLAWSNRNQFFRFAATTMRQVLIDSARAKKTKKRSGNGHHASNRPFNNQESQIDLDLLLDLDDLLTQFEREDQDAASLVKLRIYAGLSTSEAAEVLGISRSKAYGDWMFARFWFAERMSQSRPQ